MGRSYSADNDKKSTDLDKCIQRSKDHLTEVDEIYSRIVRGSYPQLIDDPGIKAYRFYADYVDSYIARDVSELTTVKDKDAFQMFLEITASLTGQELVLETISNAVGVSKPTVSSWIGILQTSGLIHLLKPYSETSAIKRNIKRPKLYFTDTGLACYLADIFDPKTLRSSYQGTYDGDVHGK